MERPPCPVCDEPLSFRWTDRHGIGACLTCNAPWKIYHYEGEGDDRHHVEKPPECFILEEWIPVLRKYWEETKSRAPNACNIPGSRYEPCTDVEFEKWHDWLAEHEDELPKREDTDAEEADEVSA